MPFSIANNDLRPEDAKILAEALHVNSSMTAVNVANNNLTTAISWSQEYTKGDQVRVDGKDGVIDYGPDSVKGYKVKFSDGTLSGYLKADKIAQVVTDMTGVKAIAEALSASSSMTSLNLASNKLVEAQLKLTKGARVTVDGQSGVISYGPDSDKEYKVKFDAGSESGYLKADKLRAITDTTGVQAIAEALRVSSSMTSLK